MGRNAIFQTARASHSVAGGLRFSSSAIDKGWALPLRPRARASIVWRTSVAVGNAAMPRTLSSRIVTVKKKAHEKKINQFFRPLFFVILFPSQLTVEHASSDARSVARPLERGIDTAASLALLWCRVIGTHYCNLVIAKQIANSYLTINRLTAGRETNRPTKTNTTHNKSIRCRPKIAVLCVESRLRSFEKTSCWFFFKKKTSRSKRNNQITFDSIFWKFMLKSLLEHLPLHLRQSQQSQRLCWNWWTSSSRYLFVSNQIFFFVVKEYDQENWEENRNWHEWLDAWRQNTSQEHRLGLAEWKRH